MVSYRNRAFDAAPFIQYFIGVYMVNRRYYMAAWRYEIPPLLLKSIRSSASLTRETFVSARR